MVGGSCMQDAVCSVCGYTVKAAGHQYVDGVCTVCGKTIRQAQQEEATRMTTSLSTKAETTLPELNVDILTQYSETIRMHLQKAHDDADASITAPAEQGRELALSATDSLRQAQTVIEEAIQVCRNDTRLKAAADSMSAVGAAIKKSAAVTSFYDSTFLKSITTIRADSTKALDALKKYDQEIKKLS